MPLMLADLEFRNWGFGASLKEYAMLTQVGLAGNCGLNGRCCASGVRTKCVSQSPRMRLFHLFRRKTSSATRCV
jgi:hypothetical protein